MSENQIVVCELRSESYGFDISKVFEIIRFQPITAVPQAPDFVEGIINLRGRIVPVVDLASRFGLPRTEPTKASRIVVAGTAGTRVGLIVDGVSEVLMVPDEAIEPTPPTVVGRTDSNYLRGIAKVDNALVILLELDALFGDADYQAMARAA
jgi:purine-binding chemotaxis protein CheW